MRLNELIHSCSGPGCLFSFFAGRDNWRASAHCIIVLANRERLSVTGFSVGFCTYSFLMIANGTSCWSVYLKGSWGFRYGGMKNIGC